MSFQQLHFRNMHHRMRLPELSQERRDFRSACSPCSIDSKDRGCNLANLEVVASE